MSLKKDIEKVGGLVTLSEMARRWEVSRQRAAQLSLEEDFPKPVTVVGESWLWAWGEVAIWRDRKRK